MRLRRPDLVLLDVAMPEMDGFEVLAKMHCEPALAAVPVVLLTGTSYVDDKVAQPGSRMIIRRPEGMRPAEALRCLGAIIDVLEPRYNDHETAGQRGAETSRVGTKADPELQNA
jgi:CheY-like chemotaxis protein